MKHETWRHDPAAYGSTQPVAARFANVDTRRHVNNIAVYGLHHEVRQRWLMAAGAVADRGAVWPTGSLLLKPLTSRTEFWQECQYPAPSSAQLRVAMFDGQSLQRVYTDPAGPPGAAALPPALRAALQSFHWLSGDTPCP